MTKHEYADPNGTVAIANLFVTLCLKSQNSTNGSWWMLQILSKGSYRKEESEIPPTEVGRIVQILSTSSHEITASNFTNGGVGGISEIPFPCLP
jgi:hypothetical protein